MIDDLRSALRSLRQAPGFVVAAVLVLSLGIGAPTAIFSLFDAAVLRPLPVKDPRGLVEVMAVYSNHRQTNVPAEVFEVARRATDCLTGVIGSHSHPASLRAGSSPERVRALFVSGNYFSVLGIGARAGRLLAEADDRQGAERTAVLSHDMWLRRFGSRPDIVGRAILVDGKATTVVGVAPKGFFGLDRSRSFDVALPLAADDATNNLWIVGRLKPGVALAEARARVAPLFREAVAAAARRLRNWPEKDRRHFLSQRLELLSAANGTVGLRWQLADSLKVLGGGVALVLLIACTNVSALLLARGDSRSGEVAVRFALGASRARIVRERVVESLLLSLLGGVLGTALAFGLHHVLVALLPLDASAAVEFRLDSHLLLFALGLSSIAGVLTGLTTSLRGTQMDLSAVLKANSGKARRGRSTSMQVILVTQVAGVLVLLVGAGLFVRSLGALRGVDPGFDIEHIVVASIDPSLSARANRQPAVAQELLLERVRSLPGVESVAIGANAIGRGGWVIDVWVDGYAYSPDDWHQVRFNEVGPGFFSTAGIPILAGRDIDAQDDRASSRVALVNGAFARKYFGTTGPLGRRFRTQGGMMAGDTEVIGVVGDSRTLSLRGEAEPAAYFPLQQRNGAGGFVLHARTRGAASSAIQAIRAEILRFDPDLDVFRIQSLREGVQGALRQDRLFATLTTLFAAVALALAGVGLYATVAQAVARRTGEIGIRVALGADRAQVVRGVLSGTLGVLGLGAAIGLPAAVAGTHLLRGYVYGVGPVDPVTLAAAAATMLATSIAACLVPARRAIRVDPVEALRCE